MKTTKNLMNILMMLKCKKSSFSTGLESIIVWVLLMAFGNFTFSSSSTKASETFIIHILILSTISALLTSIFVISKSLASEFVVVKSLTTKFVIVKSLTTKFIVSKALATKPSFASKTSLVSKAALPSKSTKSSLTSVAHLKIIIRN